MQAMDTEHDAPLHLKALIYGKPGTGKTTLGVTAPAPLILASERQALVHIRQAQARSGRKVVGALYMETLGDYANVIRTLKLGTHHPELREGPFEIKNDKGDVLFASPVWPQSIVIDSITDACKLVDADIMRRSPAKEGRDGLPVVSERYWSVLRDTTEKLFRAFRDIDFHVIFIALEDDRTVGEGDEAERQVGPAVPMRSLPGTLSAAVNMVGVMTRVIKSAKAPTDGSERAEAQISYVVRTVGPQWCMLKPYRPLRDVEEPDFSSWIQRISASIAGNAVDEAPAPDAGEAKPEPEAKPEKAAAFARTRTRTRPTPTTEASES